MLRILKVFLGSVFLIALLSSIAPLSVHSVMLPEGVISPSACRVGAVLSIDQFSVGGGVGAPNVRIAIPDDEVVAGTWAIVNNFVPDQSVVLPPNCAGIGASVDGAGLNLMAVEISTTISSPGDADIEYIQLVWDVNANGIYEPLLDLVLQSAPGSVLMREGKVLFSNGPQEPLAFLSNSAAACNGINIADQAVVAPHVGPPNGTNSRAGAEGCYIALLAIVKIGKNPIHRTKFGLELKAYAGDIPGTTGISSFNISSGFSSSRNPQASNATVDIFGGLPGPDAVFDHINTGFGNAESTFTPMNFVGGENNEGLNSRFRAPEVTFGTREAIIYAGALCDGGFLANANVPILPPIAGAPPTIAGGLASVPCVVSANTDGLLTGVVQAILKIDLPLELIPYVGAVRMYADLDCDGVLFEGGELIQTRHPFYNEPTQDLYVLFNREQAGPLFTNAGPGLGGGCAFVGGLGSADASPFPRIILWTADIHPQLGHVGPVASQLMGPHPEVLAQENGAMMINTNVALNGSIDKSNFVGGPGAPFEQAVNQVSDNGVPAERRRTQLAKFDVDNNGVIDEFELSLASSELESHRISNKEFEDIQKAHDEQTKLRTGATQYDENRDGMISASEAQKAFDDWMDGYVDLEVFQSAHEAHSQGTKIPGGVSSYDKNRDGLISFDERREADKDHEDGLIDFDLHRKIGEVWSSNRSIPRRVRDYDKNNDSKIDDEELKKAENDAHERLIDEDLIKRITDAWARGFILGGERRISPPTGVLPPREPLRPEMFYGPENDGMLFEEKKNQLDLNGDGKVDNEDRKYFNDEQTDPSQFIPDGTSRAPMSYEWRVNSNADRSDYNLSDHTCDANPDPLFEECTLRAAGEQATQFDWNKIIIPAGTFDLSSPIDVQTNVLFEGAGRNVTIIDGMGVTSLFHVDSGSLGLVGLSIVNGFSQDNGGAIWCVEGFIMGGDVSLINNEAVMDGGAIAAENSYISFYDSDFNANAAGIDGGVINLDCGPLPAAEHCGAGSRLNIITRNDAGQDGGAINVRFSDDFFITNLRSEFADTNSPFEIDNSVFLMNSAGNNGGAINVEEVDPWAPSISDVEPFPPIGIIRNSLFDDNRDLNGSSIDLADLAPNIFLDAISNYWGCPEGPGMPGCDHLEGDISNNPFLESPPEGLPEIGPFASELRKPRISNVQSALRNHEFRFTVTGLGIDSVWLKIFNLNGQSIFETAHQGTQLSWKMRDSHGQRVANGVYLYVISAYDVNGNAVYSHPGKIVVLR